MNTLMRYYRLIVKKKNGEFGIQFPKPVNLFLGLYGEHEFYEVESLRFTTGYKFLSDLREDFTHNRSRYKSISLTKIIFKEYKKSPKAQNTKSLSNDITSMNINNTPNNFYDPLGTFDGSDISCNSIGSYDFLSEMAMSVTTDKTTSVMDIPKSGRLESPIEVLIKNVKITEPEQKTTLQLLTQGSSSTHIGDEKPVSIQQIHKEGKTHYIKHEENSSITGFITEEDNLLIGRHFTETVTREGREYLLHGQYREFEKQKDGTLKLRNSLFFENGTPSTDPFLTVNADPIHQIISRANNFDRETVKEYFAEHPVIRKDTQSGDSTSPWYMFS